MADSVAAVAAAPLRRNGKKPSCEPCRKSKLSCDHIRPICGRCQRRRAPERCLYHPAPMTNGQKPNPSSIKENQPVPQDSTSPRRPASSSLENGSKSASPLPEDRLTVASPPVSGFLGPTSYSAVYTEGQSDINIQDDKLSREVNVRGWQPSKLPSWDSSEVKEGAEVLSLLADLSRYEPALSQWCEVQCLSTLTLYVRQCIALIPSDIKDSRGQ